MPTEPAPRADLRAIVFDLGGVILNSPLPAITDYEQKLGAPTGFLAQLIQDSGNDGPWARLERGELTVAEFGTALGIHSEAAGHRMEAPQLLRSIEQAATPRPAMLDAIDRLRTTGLRVATLTNAWDTPGRGARLTSVLGRFDTVIESFRVGMRKPEPRIYELTCQILNARPPQMVFLDDLGGNLKPARAMGMATIKVGDPTEALASLETLTGVSLR